MTNVVSFPCGRLVTVTFTCAWVQVYARLAKTDRANGTETAKQRPLWFPQRRFNIDIEKIPNALAHRNSMCWLFNLHTHSAAITTSAAQSRKCALWCGVWMVASAAVSIDQYRTSSEWQTGLERTQLIQAIIESVCASELSECGASVSVSVWLNPKPITASHTYNGAQPLLLKTKYYEKWRRRERKEGERQEKKT